MNFSLKLIDAFILPVLALTGGLYLSGGLTMLLLHLRGEVSLDGSTFGQYRRALGLPQFAPYAKVDRTAIDLPVKDDEGVELVLTPKNFGAVSCQNLNPSTLPEAILPVEIRKSETTSTTEQESSPCPRNRNDKRNCCWLPRLRASHCPRNWLIS